MSWAQSFNNRSHRPLVPFSCGRRDAEHCAASVGVRARVPAGGVAQGGGVDRVAMPWRCAITREVEACRTPHALCRRAKVSSCAPRDRRCINFFVADGPHEGHELVTKIRSKLGLLRKEYPAVTLDFITLEEVKKYKNPYNHSRGGACRRGLACLPCVRALGAQRLRAREEAREGVGTT